MNDLSQMMSQITHIFFDLHGTLIDGENLHLCYSTEMGRELTMRYGGTMEAWRDANRLIMQDWDSYYADLDLDGENGREHMWEGLFRTTRAMFRITGTPEPDKQELTALSRELPYHATRNCDALYPDVREVLTRLNAAGYVLGVASHAIGGHARGLLEGGRVAEFFRGAIIGTDETPTYDKGAAYYQHVLHRAQTAPECCLIVEDKPHFLHAAHRTGLKTAYIARKAPSQPEKQIGIDLLLYPDLSELLPALLSAR